MRSNRISLKTAFARQIRGMKIWHQQMPGRISAIILSRLFTKGTPFVTVFLSARILNALVAGGSRKKSGRWWGSPWGSPACWALWAPS